jgi:hypothetical protein
MFRCADASSYSGRVLRTFICLSTEIRSSCPLAVRHGEKPRLLSTATVIPRFATTEMSKSAAAISNDSQYVYIGSLCRHGARSSKIVQELRRSHLDLTQSVPTAVAVLDYVKHRGSDVSDSLELQEIIAYVTVALGNWPRMTPSDLETISRAVAAAATALCQNGAVRYAVKLATSCSIYVASPALYDGVVSGVLQSVVLPSLPLGFARTPAEISAVFTATVSESTISAIKLAADCVEAACCNNVLVSQAVVARFSRVCCVIDPRLFLVISQQLEEIISCSESKHLASQASRVIIPCVIAASVVLGKHRTVLQRLSALKSVLLSTASSKADGILHADDDRFGFLAVARACLSVSRRLPSVAFELWSALKHLDVLRPEDALVVSHLAWSLVLDGSVDNCAELLTSTPITNAGAVLSHSLLLPVVWPRISNHNETLALQCSSVTLRDALIRRFLVDARNPADVVRLCQQLGGDFTSLIDWMLTDEHTSLPFTARLVEKLGNLGLTASREVLQRLCTLCLHAQHYAAFCTVRIRIHNSLTFRCHVVQFFSFWRRAGMFCAAQLWDRRNTDRTDHP